VDQEEQMSRAKEQHAWAAQADIVAEEKAKVESDRTAPVVGDTDGLLAMEIGALKASFAERDRELNKINARTAWLTSRLDVDKIQKLKLLYTAPPGPEGPLTLH
jgi:hypothetical protein